MAEYDFGRRIAKLRKKAKLSQKQLADRIGRFTSTIGYYERDLALPPIDALIAMSEIFHVSLDYLIFGEKSNTLNIGGLKSSQKELLIDLAAELSSPTGRSPKYSNAQLDLLRRIYAELGR